MNHLELDLYLKDLLSIDEIQDYAPNGLQIEGKKEIRKVATAVTASLAVIEAAKEFNADALMVHHAYFWKNEAAVIRGMKYQRIARLIKADINLYAYHLPLDIYEAWGNNAYIARLLKIQVLKRCNKALLNIGDLATAIDAQSLAKQIDRDFATKTVFLDPQAKKIKTLAWCSGGAQDLFESAITEGVDAYITGEFSERCYHLAQESGVAFFAIGHHASERGGILSLGQHLEETFGLEHLFIDEKNPF